METTTTLPFDIDNRFIKDKSNELAEIAYSFFTETEGLSDTQAVRRQLSELQIFYERLLVPTGASGFRITTKIHPFWNIYFNGLGVAIAEANEPKRSNRAHSYRYTAEGDSLFDRNKSWRAYKEATLNESAGLDIEGAVVIRQIYQAFYEHIYHHRLENCINDLFPSSTVATQVDRMLSKFASGRSFGLPVGGQCSRILTELLMTSIDQMLSDSGLAWHRYVDDFTLITTSNENAYRALSILSHALADYGLSLNRTKTTILKRHYKDYTFKHS